MQLNAAQYFTSATCKANKIKPHKPTSEEALPTVNLVTLAAQVHVVFKLGPSEHVFTPGGRYPRAGEHSSH